MDDFILELPNFVPKAFCKHLIEKFESDHRKRDGLIIINGEERVIPELKNSKEIFISGLEDWEKDDEEIRFFMSKALEHYNKRLQHLFEHNQPIHTFGTLLSANMGDLGYTLQRQQRGAKYAWHYDGGSTGNNQMHYLFVIMYLNTLEPNEGGQTMFSNGRKIRPECGKIMMCPSSWTYPHCGAEVKADNKYILTTGINSTFQSSSSKS